MSSTTMTALVNLRMHTDVTNAFPKFTCIMYGDLFFSRSAFCKQTLTCDAESARKRMTKDVKKLLSMNESPQVLYASECLCNFGMSDSSTP